MRPIVTDGVAWYVDMSVGWSVCNNLEPCKNGWTNRDVVWGVDSGGSKEPSLDRGPDPHAKGQFWEGNVICTANGWLKEQDRQFFYNRIRALEKYWTKCISVAGNVEKWQNMMYISCDQLCQSIRTFWTSLVHRNFGVWTLTMIGLM